MQWFSTDAACAMQVGKYSPVQRAATVLYRGTQFFAVSFAASMVGHSLTKYMVRHAYLIQPLCRTHQLPCQPTFAHVLACAHTSSIMPSGQAVFSCTAPMVADLLPITCCGAPATISEYMMIDHRGFVGTCLSTHEVGIHMVRVLQSRIIYKLTAATEAKSFSLVLSSACSDDSLVSNHLLSSRG